MFLAPMYTKFLKRLHDNGIYMYAKRPKGGYVDITLEDIDVYMSNPEKFWEDYEKESIYEKK